jgi:hypothetical protein
VGDRYGDGLTGGSEGLGGPSVSGCSGEGNGGIFCAMFYGEKRCLGVDPLASGRRRELESVCVTERIKGSNVSYRLVH